MASRRRRRRRERVGDVNGQGSTEEASSLWYALLRTRSEFVGPCCSLWRGVPQPLIFLMSLARNAFLRSEFFLLYICTTCMDDSLVLILYYEFF